MINQPAFYWQTNRKLIGSMLALFSDINVSRYANNGNSGNVLRSIKVPLRFGPIEKALATQEIERAGEKVRVGVTFPRMSLEMTGMQYDETRKLATLGQTQRKNNLNPDNFLRQLNPVPYDISFELNIAVKNEGDMLQIIEQIVPNFTPSFTLNLKVIPELQLIRDVNVILVGVQPNDNYEGSFEENRLIVWKLSFVCKSWVFPVIRDAAIIKQVIAKLYRQEDLIQDSLTTTITVKVDPIDADVDDNYDILTEIEDET